MSDNSEEDKLVEAVGRESGFTAEMRSWTSDAYGNRVLVGLTLKETEELTALRKKWLEDHLLENGSAYASAAERQAANARAIELEEKHERARVQVLGAEHELRVDKPPIN